MRNFALANRDDRIVRDTLEFKRIESLARRGLDPNELVLPSVRHCDLWTSIFRSEDGQQSLWPVQGLALSEIITNNGMLANLDVGEGKTLISFLAANALDAQRPLVILPASALEEKTLKLDLPKARRHWRVNPNLRFVSYEKMSRERQHDYLWRLMPDVIIADECHRLKNQNSAVWRRFQRYFEGNPTTRFVGLSGTITVRSLRDYEHLIWLALRDGSPLPHRWMELQDWADALDEGIDDAMRPRPGALMKFCQPGEGPRDGFRRRLRDTSGYLYTENSSCGASMVIREFPVDVPPEIVEVLKHMRQSYRTPGGDEITGPLEFNAHVDELMLGFYYRWVWPNGADRPWLRARRAWKSFVRFVLRSSGQQRAGHELFGMVDLHGYEFDTEMQVALACAHGRITPPTYPIQTDPSRPNDDVYKDWLFHRNRLSGTLTALYGKRMRDPPREAVWISKYMVNAGVQWLQSNVGLLWVDKVAFLDELRATGARVYGAGENAIVSETRSAAVSLAAHGEAKNLQHYSNNLFFAIPSNSKTWEQALGRTHRSGQLADEVSALVALPCWEWWAAFDKARREAQYVEQTTGQKQKLTVSDLVVTTGEEAVQRALRMPPDPLWRTEWDTDETGETP